MSERKETKNVARQAEAEASSAWWNIIARNKSLCSESIDRGWMDLQAKSKYATDLVLCVCECVRNLYCWFVLLCTSTKRYKSELTECGHTNNDGKKNNKNIITNNKLALQRKFIKTHAETDLLLFNVNSMLCIELSWCKSRARELKCSCDGDKKKVAAKERVRERERKGKKSTLAFCNGIELSAHHDNA